jgi:hypothetical protein
MKKMISINPRQIDRGGEEAVGDKRKKTDTFKELSPIP